MDVLKFDGSFSGCFQKFDVLFMKFGRFLVLVEICLGEQFLLLFDFLVYVSRFKKDFVCLDTRLFLHIISRVLYVCLFFIRKLIVFDMTFPICVFPYTVAQVVKVLSVEL